MHFHGLSVPYLFIISNRKITRHGKCAISIYLEKLGNGNIVDGICFFTPKHLKQHVLHIGEVCWLNITVSNKQRKINYLFPEMLLN